VLREAQGSVISHESRYRIVGLKFYGADRTAEIEIPFLIGTGQTANFVTWQVGCRT
jgi:hypothetical protein